MVEGIFALVESWELVASAVEDLFVVEGVFALTESEELDLIVVEELFEAEEELFALVAVSRICIWVILSSLVSAIGEFWKAFQGRKDRP